VQRLKEQAIPLRRVDEESFRILLRYCELYCADEDSVSMDKFKPDYYLTNYRYKFEHDFMHPDGNYMSIEQVCRLMKAADVLDISPASELFFFDIGHMRIRNLTHLEIREELKIVNDFTEEEEKQIRENNKWTGEE